MKKLNNLILICLMLSTIVKAQSGNELEKKIQTAHQAWFEGLLVENLFAIDQILSDNVTLGFPGGNVVSKQEFVDCMKNGSLFYDSTHHESSNLRIYGNTGIINGKSNLTYRFKIADDKFNQGHVKLTFTAVIS